MNLKNRLMLALASCPSIILWAHMAQAAQISPQPVSPPFVLNLSLQKLDAELAAQHPFLDLTEEESNTAIAMFGCDCPAHLNRLRLLRGQPLLY